MFGIGGFELFLILLFGFLIFGPDKLPAIAKTIGKGIAKFRSAQEEMSGVLKGEMVFDKDADDPFKNPLDALDDVAAKASKGAEAAKKAATTASKKVGDAKKTATAGTATAKKAADAGAEDGAGEGEAGKPARTESFAERKARYDKERSERKQAEADAAKAKEAEEKKVAAEKRKAEAAAKRAEAEAKKKAEEAKKTVTEAADAPQASAATEKEN